MDARKEYRKLSQEEKDDLLRIKYKAEEFWEVLAKYRDGREKELASIKLEEAVMWATKHITE